MFGAAFVARGKYLPIVNLKAFEIRLTSGVFIVTEASRDFVIS